MKVPLHPCGSVSSFCTLFSKERLAEPIAPLFHPKFTHIGNVFAEAGAEFSLAFLDHRFVVVAAREIAENGRGKRKVKMCIRKEERNRCCGECVWGLERSHYI